MSRAWMPLYVGDYLRDTAHLKTIEHGTYLLLIMHYWDHGPLPDDPEVLRRITGLDRFQWGRHWPAVAPFFKLVTFLHTNPVRAALGEAEQLPKQMLTHKRLDAEIAKAETIKTKRQIAGQKGGLKSSGRANMERHIKQALAKQTGHQSQSHIESSSSESVEREKGDRGKDLQSGSPSLRASLKRQGWVK